MITVSTIREFVVGALSGGDHPEDFDVDAIVNALKTTYDLVGEKPEMTCDDIPADKFWALVSEHETTAAPAPADTMTSEQVAKLLGIAPNSVATTLARRGVQPTHREPGRGGQNVYSAAAVRAVATPPSSTVPDPLPTADPIRFARVDDRCTAQTFVNVVDTIAGGVPPMTWSRGEFTPTRISAEFVHNHDGNGWVPNVNVHGFRIRKDGSAGADDAHRYVVFVSEQPAWVGEWVAANTPTWQPDVR